MDKGLTKPTNSGSMALASHVASVKRRMNNSAQKLFYQDTLSTEPSNNTVSPRQHM